MAQKAVVYAVDFEKAIDAANAATLNRLTRLRALHQDAIKGQRMSIELRFQYIQELYAWCETVYTHPQLLSNMELEFQFKELQCNCIWFLYYHQGVDVVLAYLTDTLTWTAPRVELSHLEEVTTAVGLVQNLNDVIDSKWLVDQVIHPAYPLDTLRCSLALLRAWGYYLLAHFYWQNADAARFSVFGIHTAVGHTVQAVSLRNAAACLAEAYQILTEAPAEMSIWPLANACERKTINTELVNPCRVAVHSLGLRKMDTREIEAKALKKNLSWLMYVKPLLCVAFGDYYYSTGASDKALGCYRLGNLQGAGITAVAELERTNQTMLQLSVPTDLAPLMSLNLKEFKDKFTKGRFPKANFTLFQLK